MEHLNRPKGYEIARVLIHHKKSHRSIKRDLPYVDVHDEEINRILDPQNKECDVDVFQRARTYGETKWTLNNDLFSEEELEVIKDRAKARILDNTSMKEEDFDKPADAVHQDISNMQSWIKD